MEVIGAVSSLIGIFTFTMQIAKSISDLIGNIKDAPQSLRRLDQEVNDLGSILSQIDQPDLEDSGLNLYTTPVEMSLRTCRDELERLRELLTPLAPKSAEDGRRRRTWQGFKKFFKDDDLREAVNNLQSRKLSICLALMANLSSKKKLRTGGKKNIRDNLSEKDGGGGDLIDIYPSQRLLRRTTTFKPEQQVLASEPVNTGINETALYPSMKLLENIISQTIEQTMQRIRGEFLQEPSARIEDFLSLNTTETQQLWSTNLQSIKDFRAADLERKREDFLQSLPSPDYHGDKIKAKNAQPGTCKWIFDHPQYLAWREDEGSSILYAMGKPGSGKTVLSRHVLETLREIGSENESQVLYCFCNNRDNPNQTAPDILGAMVHQFLSDRNSLFPLVLNKRQGILKKLSKSDASSWSLESLWEIFLILVESAQLDVYCIIDALDECEAESVSELLSLISEMVANSSKNSSEGPMRVKFFLTSRPFERLEVDLDPKIVRVIPLTPEIVNQDIERIVHDGMDKLEKRLRLKKVVKDRLWGALVDRSEGMFLWVLLAMKQLDRARFVTAQKLEKIIQGLPNGLDGIYDRMLEGLEANVSDPEDLSLIRKMIMWVVLAQRPLTISEFRVAMAIELNSDSTDSIETMLYISREIRNLCGSFLEVVSKTETPRSNTTEGTESLEDDDFEDPTATVRLIHQSAKDYFFDRDLRLSPQLSKFRIHEKRGHSEIGSVCLTYLLFKDFEAGPRQLNSGISGTPPVTGQGDDYTALGPVLKQLVDGYPFLGYATLAWGYHVQSSIETADEDNIFSTDIMKLTCRFLQQPLHLEHWYQIYKFLKGSEVFRPTKVNALHVACLIDLPAIAEYVLHNWSIDIDERSGEGETALIFAVQAGIDSSVSNSLRILLENKPDVNARDNQGRTALNLAARHADQLSIVNLLLDREADIECNDSEFWTALHCAAGNGHLEMVRLLLDRGANIESKTLTGSTALHLATENGHKKTATLLLDHGADTESRTTIGYTALHQEANNGHYEMVRLLLERGAKVESKLNTNHTPLHLAAESGYQRTVEVLLDKGAYIESRISTGHTPLHLAANYGHPEVIKLLLDRGAILESKLSTDHTPLHQAVEEGHREAVELLLDRGADMENRISTGHTALHLAANYGRRDVAELLLDRGAILGSKLIDSKHTALHQAAEEGHRTTVELLLDRGAEIEDRIITTHTPLHLAANYGHLKTAELLLDRGADIGSTLDTCHSSLHIAAQNGYRGIVELLLDRGADIGGRIDIGYIALHLTGTFGHPDTAELLLDRGADIECKNNDGETTLLLAVTNEQQEVVKLFLDRGANIETKNSDGFASLHIAVSNGYQRIVELLLERGANIESREEFGRTPLYMAAEDGNKEMTQLLLEKGADIESKSTANINSLVVAATNGYEEVAELLWSRGTATGSKDNDDWAALYAAVSYNQLSLFRIFIEKGLYTPQESKESVSEDKGVRYGELLRCAAFNGNIEIIESLLNSGINVDAASTRGGTALHIAASEGNLEAVDIFLKHKADPLRVDLNGWSPIVCAWRSRCQGVVERLLEVGSVLPDINHLATHAPTGWSEFDKSKVLVLSKGNLHIEIPSGDYIRPNQISCVRANHCMPAEKDIYYYEVEIINGGNSIEIGIGFTREFSRPESLPGWLKGTLGYHGDDGRTYASNTQGLNYDETFTVGDIIGCGVNFDQSTAFFTKNGKYLGTALENVRGQLYPAIGFLGPGGQVYTNFGQKPFAFQSFSEAIILKD